MEADVDGVVVGVGPGVGVSDASVGTGVGGSGDWVIVDSGAGELAGNAVIAAPSLGVAARTSCGVSGGEGAGADVAVPAGSRYRCHRPSWGRGLLPAAQQLSACPGWVSHPVAWRLAGRAEPRGFGAAGSISLGAGPVVLVTARMRVQPVGIPPYSGMVVMLTFIALRLPADRSLPAPQLREKLNIA